MTVANEKLEVFTSDTELKFFAISGWTEQLLKSCIIRGDIKFHMGGYWTLDRDTGAKYDVKKLNRIAGNVYNYEDTLLHGMRRINHLIAFNGQDH